MAIQIKNTYSGRTDNTDPNWPYGKGRNVVGGVEGTGTPFEADWYNNLEGFLQGLLLEADITPDGDVDNANNSQLVDAVKGLEKSADKVITSDGRNVQERLDDLPSEVDAAGTAATLIQDHNSNAGAHPELSSFITAEADRAEVAAGSASIKADLYDDTTDGISGTLEGEQFQVLSEDNLEYIRYSHDAGGVATEIGRYPSSNYVKNSQETLYSKFVTGTVITGSLVSSLSGVVSSNSDYNRTDYIPIESEQAFRFEGRALLQSGIAFYDESKVFISGVQAPVSGVYSSPLGAKYLIACTNVNENPLLEVLIITTGSNNFTVNGESQKVQLNTLSESLLDLIDKTTADDGAIAADGSIASTTAYTVTDYITVDEDSYIEYTGRTVSPYLGVALYDKDKQFISGIANSGDVVSLPIRTAGAAYIRACSSNSAANTFTVKTLKYNYNKLVRSISENVDDLLLPEINVVSGAILEGGYLDANGDLVSSSAYEATEYLGINGKSIFYYTGRVISPAWAIAIYDESLTLIETKVFSGGNYENLKVEIDNEDAKYIRACSSTGSPEPFALRTLSYNISSESKPDIKLLPISATEFDVYQLTEIGEYIVHKFKRRVLPDYSEDGWYSQWVSHNGENIAQGNFNFIHNIDNANESSFVGVGHGCETFSWIRFFVDGKLFDPENDTAQLTGDRFHFQFLSDIYTVDDSASPAGFAVAALPLEVSTKHYMDCEITKYGIKRYNKLILQRDNIIFNQLIGAMQQTEQPLINDSLLYNADVPFRIYFPVSNGTPEPLAPDTTTIGGNSLVNGVDKVTAYGTGNGYSYVVETKAWNADNSKAKDASIRSWTERTSSNKMYFFPEVTSYNASTVGKLATQFNSGDVIECYSYTKYGVSKL